MIEEVYRTRTDLIISCHQESFIGQCHPKHSQAFSSSMFPVRSAKTWLHKDEGFQETRQGCVKEVIIHSQQHVLRKSKSIGNDRESDVLIDL